MEERMKTRPLIATASLGLLVVLSLASSVAFADSGHHGHRGHREGSMGKPGRPPGSHHHGFNQDFKQGFKGQRSFNHHRSRHHHGFRPFLGWGVATVYIPPLYSGYGGPSYYSAPPPYYGPTYPAPPLYGPPVGGSISVALAAPTPNVIHYPNGRYELVGDGVTPYTWVWIPNPPPPPPVAPPVPPGESSDEPTSRSGLPPPPSRLYRWIDEQGVVHLTNRADAVPTMYRTPAKSTPRP